MRLRRQVAAGLVLGAFIGFLGALLRPRRRELPAELPDSSASAVPPSPHPEVEL